MPSMTVETRLNIAKEVANRLPVAWSGIKKRWTANTYSGSQLSVPVDTGNLKNSGQMGDGEVSYHAEYAAYVHEGTSRMAGRPFLRNAADAATDVAKQDLMGLESQLG